MDENVKNNQISDDDLENVSGGSYADRPEDRLIYDSNGNLAAAVHYEWDEDLQEWVEIAEEFGPPEEGDGEPILA